MIKFTPMRIAHGIRGFEMTAQKGDVFEAPVPQATTRSNHKHVAMHVEGETELSIVRGNVIGFPQMPIRRKAGDSTLDHPWEATEGSVFRVEVMSDVYRYLCISRIDEAPMNAHTVRAAAGEQVTIEQGRQIVVGYGKLDIEGTIYSAPAQIVAESRTVTGTVIEDLFALNVETPT